MPLFVGEYESTLDPKGRFLLPAGFKKQLKEGENTFVMNRGMEKHLCLYTKGNWDLIIKNISKLNDFDPNVRSFRRLFLAGATEVEIDSAGRLLMPSVLKEYANLSKDIILSCALHKVEIWDSIIYKKFFEQEISEEFSRLAAEVMANIEFTD